MADKRPPQPQPPQQQQRQGPQNYSAHSVCIYCVILSASDKGGGGGGGENGGQAAAFMYLYVDVSHQDERGRGSWTLPRHQSAPFNTLEWMKGRLAEEHYCCL